MKSVFLRLLASVVFVTAFLPAVTAHGMGQGMYTLKYVDGQTLILVTPNVDTTQSNVPIQYNFRLYDMVGKPVPFGNARTEIKNSSEIVSSQNLRISANNDTTLHFTYPKQGTYTIHIEFMDNTKRVARGEFPIVVSKGPAQGFFSDAFTVKTGLAFLLGAATATLVLKRQKLMSALSGWQKRSVKKA